MELIRRSGVVRQQEINEAAKNLISMRGMESVTIDAIADEVGLSEGAIYRHFNSKRQILNLLIDDIEFNLMKTLRESQVDGNDAMQNLELIMEAHFGHVGNFMTGSFIVITEAIAFDVAGLRGRVSSMLARYVDFLKGVFECGVKDGSVRSDVDPEVAATAFFGLIQSTATLRALNEYQDPVVEWRNKMWDIYKRGVLSET